MRKGTQGKLIVFCNDAQKQSRENAEKNFLEHLQRLLNVVSVAERFFILTPIEWQQFLYLLNTHNLDKLKESLWRSGYDYELAKNEFQKAYDILHASCYDENQK